MLPNALLPPTRVRTLPLLMGAAVLSLAPTAVAQSLPDAGRVLDEMKQPAQPTLHTTPLTIQQPSLTPSAQPGGPQVVLQQVAFAGNTLFTDAELMAVLDGEIGASHDLAGLQRLAQRITAFYRMQDYPFSLAYLPPQSLTSGALTIAVVEARYGAIEFTGDEALRQAAASRLAYLTPDAPIKGQPLARAVHLLGDLPGITVDPVLMPGQAVGTGDLAIAVNEAEQYAASLGVDNHGNRYTGTWRTHGTASINRLLTLGDTLDLSVLLTEESLWYGSLGYSLPLTNTGLRGYTRYTHTHYQLGEEFKDLGATGTARIGTLGLEYPLIRSERTNLYLDLAYNHKRLEDTPAELFATTEKSSDTLVGSLRFDHRDGLFGGGLTWADVDITAGDLSLDQTLMMADRVTAKTAGSFSKLNLELARIQRLNTAFTLYGRLSGQWTHDNLDSSEGMSLGGANGVRAYPEGEAFGDRGWLGQLELRYQYKQVQPYLFYDAGVIELNARPWASGDNQRTLAGAGVGLRANIDNWQFNLASAWRTEGGTPQSDTKEQHPRVWGSVQYRF